MTTAKTATLGIELGSTQIKCVLLATDGQELAHGTYQWENQLVDGIWTYALTDVWTGLQAAYAALAKACVPMPEITAIGVSAMMHGYLAFDAKGQQLAPFATWRNNHTQTAADELSALFGVGIPARWSIAHLHQAVKAGAPHLKHLAFLTTLAGYVHWQLSGEKVLGIGDASGMFPIDSATKTYRADLLAAYSALPAVAAYPWRIAELLPEPLVAGTVAGHLTEAGARLLDPTGALKPGAVMAPPEGDAGTGMVATNAVRPGTGNVSLGTSVFLMLVLEKPLRQVLPDVDLVTTPSGEPVAMVHANNCTSELNAWMGLFTQVADALGGDTTPDAVYGRLLEASLEAEPGAGGMLVYANVSAENITQVHAGRPLLVRGPHVRLNLANFMQAQLYAAFAPLAIGTRRLRDAEDLQPVQVIAQGGLLKTPKIAQQALADALAIPVAVMPTAATGGPYGMALLAQYAQAQAPKPVLGEWLAARFAGSEISELRPTTAGVLSFRQFIQAYSQALPLAQNAGDLVSEK